MDLSPASTPQMACCSSKNLEIISNVDPHLVTTSKYLHALVADSTLGILKAWEMEKKIQRNALKVFFMFQELSVVIPDRLFFFVFQSKNMFLEM